MKLLSGAKVSFLLLSMVAAYGQAAETVDYLQQVKPLLAAKCFACHGALRQESGLRLDAASLILKGGDSGPAIVPGKVDESFLLERVSAADADERMPPEGEGEPLTEQQLALLRTWIERGAVAPDEPIPADPRQHWAYQPPARSAVPAPRDTDWALNPIDAFVAGKLEQHGLAPAGPAEREVLLRRVCLDLTGLPPTAEQLHQFLNDESAAAYEKAVDRLLASPRYGERWGRHWMDVWRYSDWAGYGNEIRYSQRHIWRWRDWIVESLNGDKPYDRMILEMLAADELAPGDDDAARATGFLARNWYKFDRNSWLDETIEHTAKAFLATTIKCSRCHDHKYDPLTQQEYYRFRAIFEPYEVRTDHVPGQTDAAVDGLVRVYDASPDTPTYLFVRGNPNQPVKEHPLDPGVPTAIGGAAFRAQPVSLPLASYYPALRSFVVNDMVAERQAAADAAETALSKAKAELARQGEPNDARRQAERKVALAEKSLATATAALAAIQARINAEQAKNSPAEPPPDTQGPARVAADAQRQAAVADAEEKLLAAEQELEQAQAARTENDAKSAQRVADAEKKLAAAGKAREDAAAALEKTDASYQPLGPTYPKSTTGRRLALARWIVDRRNPLTARVAVNHVWLRHFGQPLVDSVDDFGLRSPRPLHAELLDFLAVRFMDDGWSIKRLHRLIVTSRSYRMSSKVRDGAAGNSQADPDNRLLWRTNARRMEAEAVRDALLHVAGSLDLTLGGPDLDHARGLTTPRRSLYFRHAREKQMEFLLTFDAANPRECYRRRESVRPQQALALINSSLALAQSRLLARRLVQSDATSSSDEAFVTTAFETILSRRPTEAESRECCQFLQLQRRQLSQLDSLELLAETADEVPASSDPAQRARENLVLVLLNHNDFVTIR